MSLARSVTSPSGTPTMTYRPVSSAIAPCPEFKTAIATPPRGCEVVASITRPAIVPFCTDDGNCARPGEAAAASKANAEAAYRALRMDRPVLHGDAARVPGREMRPLKLGAC